MQTLITATSIDEFRAKATNQDLPPGTKIRLTFELPAYAPIGNLADLAGAEFFYSYFVGADTTVDDVYGEARKVTILGTVNGTPILLLVTIIIAALSALGIAYLVSRIVLEGDLPTWTVPVIGTTAFLAVAAVAVFLIVRQFR